MLVFIVTGLTTSGKDTTAVRCTDMKSRMFRLFHGRKGVERYETWKTYNAFVIIGEFQSAVDHMTREIGRQDLLGGEYRMHTAGYYYGMRGSAWYFLEEYDSAMSDLNRSVGIVPDWPLGYYFRGLTEYAMEDFRSAVDDHSMAISLKKKTIAFHFARGLAYDALGDHEAAEMDFLECVKLDPPGTGIYNQLAYIREKEGDYDGAKASLEKVIKAEPDKPYGYYQMALLYSRMNVEDTAIILMKKGLNLDPRNDLLMKSLGWIYYDKGDHDLALETFSQCMDLNEKSYDAALAAAFICYVVDDRLNSRKYLDQAKAIQPILEDGMEGITILERTCGFHRYTQEEKEVLARMFEELR